MAYHLHTEGIVEDPKLSLEAHHKTTDITTTGTSNRGTTTTDTTTTHIKTSDIVISEFSSTDIITVNTLTTGIPTKYTTTTGMTTTDTSNRDITTTDTTTTDTTANILRHFETFFIILILLVLAKYCVLNYVDKNILDIGNNKYFKAMAEYTVRTYGFLMRDFGTITGEGNGLQGAGMVYASVNGSSLYKTNLKSTQLDTTSQVLNLSVSLTYVTLFLK